MTLSFTSPEEAAREETFKTNATAAELDPKTSYFAPTEGLQSCRREPGSGPRPTSRWGKSRRARYSENTIVHRDDHSDSDDKSIFVKVKDMAASLYSWVTSPRRTASLVTSGIKRGITTGIASGFSSGVSSVYETLVPEVCRDAISSSSIGQYSRFWWTDWDTRAWMVVKQNQNGKYVETTPIDKPSQAFEGKGSTADIRIYTSPWVVSAVESSKSAMWASRW